MISIATAAMLGSINISVWEARKQDKKTADEVTQAKGARSKRAATVHKHLFSECPALEAIKSLRGEVRQWFNTQTLPWDDNGRRLITTAQYLNVMGQAAKYEQRFNDLIQVFLRTYSTEISKQAFEMGALFDRAEYPPESEVAAKFRFSFAIEPVPESGDFRVDIANEAAQELREQYDKAMQARVATAVADAWDRVKTQVEWVRDRMAAVLEHDPDAVEEIIHRGPVKVGTEEVPEYDDDGNFVGTTTRDIMQEGVVSIEIKKKRRPKLYDSMLEQGLELCTLLTSLNVTGDPKLEQARQALETALSRVDMDSLKTTPELQNHLKNKMDEILSEFSL
jgi:hypothetical protein